MVNDNQPTAIFKWGSAAHALCFESEQRYFVRYRVKVPIEARTEIGLSSAVGSSGLTL